MSMFAAAKQSKLDCRNVKFQASQRRPRAEESVESTKILGHGRVPVLDARDVLLLGLWCFGSVISPRHM